jgi:hypothetical protein
MRMMTGSMVTTWLRFVEAAALGAVKIDENASGAGAIRAKENNSAINFASQLKGFPRLACYD